MPYSAAIAVRRATSGGPSGGGGSVERLGRLADRAREVLEAGGIGAEQEPRLRAT